MACCLLHARLHDNAVEFRAIYSSIGPYVWTRVVMLNHGVFGSSAPKQGRKGGQKGVKPGVCSPHSLFFLVARSPAPQAWHAAGGMMQPIPVSCQIFNLGRTFDSCFALFLSLFIHILAPFLLSISPVQSPTPPLGSDGETSTFFDSRVKYSPHSFAPSRHLAAGIIPHRAGLPTARLAVSPAPLLWSAVEARHHGTAH